jgi:pilus assembly protein Flp/PilA
MTTLFAALYSRMLLHTHRMRREDGLEAVEYALIAALIAVAIIGAVTALQGSISTVFGQIQAALTSAN